MRPGPVSLSESFWLYSLVDTPARVYGGPITTNQPNKEDIMKVFINRLGQEPLVFNDAARSNNVRIETEQGVFSIMENKDGSLNISESTHMHLTLQPRASNSLQIGTVLPEAFNVKGGE